MLHSLPTWTRRLLLGCLLCSLSVGQAATAQSPPPDSQRLQPDKVEGVQDRVERVQNRIETIRRTGPQRTIRVGTRPVEQSSRQPSDRAAPRSERTDRLPSAPARPRLEGFTQAELRWMEERLREVFAELMAQEQPPIVQERRGVPQTVGPDRAVPDTVIRSRTDTVRLAADTVRVTRDSVRIVRDTLRQTRVDTVEYALLDAGIFRAFEVNFAFGTTELQPRAARTLDAVGDVLERYPELRVEISGHTDNVGEEEVNQRVSEERAGVVASYLQEQFDIDASQLQVRGYGESQPIASNESPSGRALNRRVEFTVLNPDALSRPQ